VVMTGSIFSLNPRTAGNPSLHLVVARAGMMEHHTNEVVGPLSLL
jgi:hypothetical protein